jgi:hypothetical protein
MSDQQKRIAELEERVNQLTRIVYFLISGQKVGPKDGLETHKLSTEQIHSFEEAKFRSYYEDH